MSTMLIAFNGAREMGQFLGDTLVSIKAAFLFAQNYPCAKYLLALSPHHDLNFLWKKFIDDFRVEVVYDTLHQGDMPARFAMWNKWRKERVIDGREFSIYKELYRRIDGAHRQSVLCGREAGLGRKNIFEYFYYGQEHVSPPLDTITEYAADTIYYPVVPAERCVFIAPFAKCQGNSVFTFGYWTEVVRACLDAGLSVTVNHDGGFGEEFNGNQLYRKVFPGAADLLQEVCRHKIVACGNTGVGWLAAAAGVPLLAMQPVDSNMADYRYEWCGVKALVEFLEQPDWVYCVKRLIEECEKQVILTTGCFDVLHAGHVRHLEESRAMGTRLVVALNSDTSVKRLKGEDRPFHPQSERETVLRALRWVDDVRIFDGDDASKLIREIRPAVITNGCDHKVEEIVGKAFVEQYGGKAVVTRGTREQSSTKTIQAVRQTDVLKAIRDAAHLSPNPFHKLKLMADEFTSVMNLAGDVADLGAYRGGCSLILRRLAPPEKELHVFDTWNGNPLEDPLCHHKVGEWVADFEQCKRVVGEGAHTHYHRGVFPATAAGLEGRKFCFVFVDPDTYMSVKDAIAWFWPRMVTGGKMFFDDYDWPACAGVKRAVDEAFQAGERSAQPPPACSCVVVKK